ncbi:alpha-amylase family glycosyl hydrolase [Virgisporangium aurantiacum]|uniref:Alpha-amylase n=1 Tax=Virgisporangium aurantiacum TaxID=175570 RepID=A0A8J3Z6I7_9ACTN|nr:alpha-amylase family glycosyl hydrolase [Virgisporangium aurantiacum]GIJ57273.1 alpha-amylase [Virgisporangium aurantiacum]
MAISIFDPGVTRAIDDARRAASTGREKTVSVNGSSRTLRYPFPSPTDWRDCWIYFLLIDRFNNPTAPPRGVWNRRFDHRQGGTFAGVTRQLDYLQDLGVRGVWLSPVVKNPGPDWRYNYHGYAAQDFLNLDERFASDGTLATAEQELTELVEQAHARDIYVILDVVINHAGRVFDYVRDGQAVSTFADPAVMDAPAGAEPPIRWLDGLGQPRADWQEVIPPATVLSPDDAVYPDDLRRRVFFRRRGTKLTDRPEPGGFVRGDFDDLRQLVVEYDATPASEADLRARYGASPVLSILIRAHSYLLARYDLDGLRIDTAKYVSPVYLERYGNAIREFGHTIGKHNVFTFGEIYDSESTIAQFVGRNSSETQSFGIDSALDFPLFFTLPAVAKGFAPVEAIRDIFQHRKEVEAGLLSSHGEAGRFFVSFLDNHDQKERFRHPSTRPEQVTIGLACLFTLQGIPQIYYGTEQALSGTLDASGSPDLASNESTREALWGSPNAFSRHAQGFADIQALAALRRSEPALRYGRLYFREVSGNGTDFGHSFGAGGLIAFSRILSDREVTVVANCHTGQPFDGFVLQDPDLNRPPRTMTVAYSNTATGGTAQIVHIAQARFFSQGSLTGIGAAAALPVRLGPMEVQVLSAR